MINSETISTGEYDWGDWESDSRRVREMRSMGQCTELQIVVSEFMSSDFIATLSEWEVINATIELLGYFNRKAQLSKFLSTKSSIFSQWTEFTIYLLIVSLRGARSETTPAMYTVYSNSADFHTIRYSLYPKRVYGSKSCASCGVRHACRASGGFCASFQVLGKGKFQVRSKEFRAWYHPLLQQPWVLQV